MNDREFFLLYCDESGEVMADTWHQTLDSAIGQANWEFQVEKGDWIEGEFK